MLKEPLVAAGEENGVKKSDEAHHHHGNSLDRIGCFFGGLVRDYKLRFTKENWATDFKYGLRWKTLSSALFMFFATFASTVALGELIRRQTNNRIGITEFLLMNSVAGMIHSLLGCQPLLVLRPTGPITAIITFISTLSDSFHFDFFLYLSWTGIFVGIYMFLIASTEMCRFIKLLTRFTHDIFAFFVCTIYIHDGLTGIIDRFDPDKMVDMATSLFATVLSIITFAIALWLHFSRSWKSLTKSIRSFLSDYALSLAVAFTVLISFTLQWGTSRIAQRLGRLVERVHVPSGFRPTCGFNATFIGATVSCDDAMHTARPWFVGLSIDNARLPLVSAATALPIVFFFFMDQNVSSLLTQRKAVGLSKGSYYHSSFLCMAIFCCVGPLFGLPFVTGSLPHSPQLAKALWSRKRYLRIQGETHAEEEAENDEPEVYENRIAPFIMYFLIGAVLLCPAIIETLPLATIDAILFFVGVAGLFECELWERLLLLCRHPKTFPIDKKYTKVSWKKMHGYTLLQIFLLGIAWAVQLSPAGLLFSVLICMLVPFRIWVVPLLFTPHELDMLDAPDEECCDENVRQYSLASSSAV